MEAEVIEKRLLDVPTSAIVFSVALHLLAPLFVIGIQSWSESNYFLKWKSKGVPKQSYQSFIQVDVVALPDLSLADKKNVDVSLPIVDKAAETPVPVKPLPNLKAAEEMVAAEKEKTPQSSEVHSPKLNEVQTKLLRREQDAALKHLAEEAAREAALKSLAERPGKLGRKKIAGNILSKGSSQTGKIGNASEQYADRLKAAIEEHIRYYPWHIKKKLKGGVYLEVLSNGRAKIRIVNRSSGDRLFDSAILQAIDSAQPLPLPDDLSILSEGFEIEFKPEAK